MQVWIGQDSNHPYPASSTLMWSTYAADSGQWTSPEVLQYSQCITSQVIIF